MLFFKSPQQQLNARLVQHLNNLAKAGLDISGFDKKKILRLEEVNVQLIQDVNELRTNNITQYDKIYPYLQTLRMDLEKVMNAPSQFNDAQQTKIKELVHGIIIVMGTPRVVDESKRIERLQVLTQ